jgi:hypothetical protein
VVVRHDGLVTRRRKVMYAVLLVLAGVVVAVFVEFLRREGLERASAWVTVVGFFVATGLAVAGLVLGWLAWRRPVAGTGAAPATSPGGQQVDQSGRIDQRNTGGVNLANTGNMGDVDLPSGP